ncbi:hypothetical protein J6590_086541 [Homalodisca vitripennis]|nr:hypothetical protein J6590_086541 [Homalodisca vitripennis]
MHAFYNVEEYLANNWRPPIWLTYSGAETGIGKLVNESNACPITLSVGQLTPVNTQFAATDAQVRTTTLP